MVIRSITGVNLKRSLPVNVSDQDKNVFERVGVAKVDNISIAQLGNANVLYDGTIYKQWRTIKGMLLSNDAGEVVPYSWIDLARIFFLWPKQRVEHGELCMVIHNNYSNTYYHWLLEALPRLFLIKDKIAGSTLLLPDNHNQKFHHECLSIFDVQKIFWMKEKVTYFTTQLLVSSQIGRIANYHPDVIIGMVKYLKSRISLNINLGDKLYISRRNSSRRRVINEADLELHLIPAGFVVVDLEQYSFSEQVSIMHHCRYVVGIHGAGLANIIFMEPNGRVFELRKDDRGENYFFYSLAATANHRYYYQFCESVAPDVLVQDADIRVNVSLFKKNIGLMLSAQLK